MTVTPLDLDMLITYMRHSRTRILDVVDAQNDFMLPTGALAVHPDKGARENASEIIHPMGRFFDDLPEHAFDVALIKYDTHFADEYRQSPESHLFPPHCLFGTAGWHLAVDILPLASKFPAFFMAKNEFDMWGTNPTGVARQSIRLNAPERAAYDNLFKVIPFEAGDNPAELLTQPHHGIPRDDFMEPVVNSGTLVVLCGVASDFCDRQALLGYLARGATVIVADDLTRGIGGPASSVPETGTMRDVIAEVIESEPRYNGRLHCANSCDIAAALGVAQQRPFRPGTRLRPAEACCG